MAEYGYGYQSAFGRHTPMFNAEVTERLPQLSTSDAKPSMASGKVIIYSRSRIPITMHYVKPSM